jgi:hypothetical protein
MATWRRASKSQRKLRSRSFFNLINWCRDTIYHRRLIVEGDLHHIREKIVESHVFVGVRRWRSVMELRKFAYVTDQMASLHQGSTVL